MAEKNIFIKMGMPKDQMNSIKEGENGGNKTSKITLKITVKMKFLNFLSQSILK